MVGAALGAIHVGPMPVEQALRWLDTHAAAVDSRHALVSATRAVLLAMLGRFDDARALVAAVLERQASYGVQLGGLTAYSWYVETLAEDHVAGERMARRAYEELETEGSIAFSSTVACQWAQSLYELSRYDEAKAALAIGEEYSATDDTVNQILVPQVRAKLLAREGDDNSAKRLARDAVAIAENTDWLNVQGDALTDLAHILTLARQQEARSSRA